MRHRIGHLLSLLLTPLGATVATIGFFLPWVKFTCLGTKRSLSGAQAGGTLWIVPIAAVLIVAVFVYLLLRGQVQKSRLATALSALAALAAILIKYMNLVSSLQGEYGLKVARDIGLRLQPGAVATVLGMLLVLVGVPFLRRRESGAPPASAEIQHGSQNQPDRVT